MASYIALVLVVGLITGNLWHGSVTLPEFLASEDGSVRITERAQSQIFASDALFVIIGLIAGVVLGVAAWRSFRSIGWPVAIISTGAGLVAALLCWWIGVLRGPTDFAQRVADAVPGDSIPIDFQLHAPAALMAWCLGAIIPVMLYANLSRQAVLADRPSKPVNATHAASKPELGKTELGRPELGKAESPKIEPARLGPPKAEPPKPEPQKPEPDTTGFDQQTLEPTKPEPSDQESPKPDPA